MFKLMIDAGHGGNDLGAVYREGGQTLLTEASVVRDVGVRMREHIIPWINAGLIQLSFTSDPTKSIFLSLSKRAEKANEWGADLFLSIHANAASAPSAHGYEAFTTPGRTKSDEAATHLLREFGEEFPDRRLRADYSDQDADKEANFTVLKRTAKAAVLFELEFIHNQQGSNFLSSPDKRDRMAKALAIGCLKFAGVYDKLSSTTPSPPPATTPDTASPIKLARARDLLKEVDDRMAELAKILG